MLPDIVVRIKGYTAADAEKHMREPGRRPSEFSVSFYNGTTHAVDVVMTPADYLHHIKGSQYALNVYLTEKEGSVYGANFMNQKVSHIDMLSSQ